MATPAQKSGDSNNFSMLVSNKKLQYTCMGHPPIYKTNFQQICTNLRRGLNRRGSGMRQSFDE